MTFNYAIEKKKFDAAWSILRKFYLSAGMDPDAVEEMHKYDWDMFKAARIEALHTQELALPRDAEEDDDLDSQLMKKFGKQLTTEYDTFGSHSRYWWLEELSNPCLAVGAKLLNEEDKQILTMYIVDELTTREIAYRIGKSQRTVSRTLCRIFSLFKENA